MSSYVLAGGALQLPPRTAGHRAALLEEGAGLEMAATTEQAWHYMRGIWVGVTPAFESASLLRLLGGWSLYDRLGVDPLHDVSAVCRPCWSSLSSRPAPHSASDCAVLTRYANSAGIAGSFSKAL